MNVGEHLLDRPRHHWSAPDHRLVRAGEEADRHEPDAESLERYELGVHHLRLALDAHHARDRRTVDVGIEQPDPGPAATERAGEIYRHRGLADASLSGRDRDHLLDPWQHLVGPAPVEGRAHVGSHLQIDRSHAGKIADQLFGHGLETVPNRAGRRRQLEGEADLSVAADDEIFDHAEADDVAAEVGILDRGEHAQDLLGGWRPQWAVIEH